MYSAERRGEGGEEGGFRNALGTFMHCERFKRRPKENDLGRDLDFVLSARSFSPSFSFVFPPYSTYAGFIRVATSSNTVIGFG